MKKLIGLTSIVIALTACSGGPVFDLSNIEDKFDGVSYNNKIDILWVVDTSPSMHDDRVRITSQIESMISTMDSKSLDYRMAATTMDMGSSSNPTYSQGRFVGSPSIISNSTPNKVNAFKTMINVPTADSNLARGLGSMKSGLSEESLRTTNSGFFRDGALLAVIFVTDERDWSSGTWEDKVTFLDALKKPLENGNRGWLANFIGVIDDSKVCPTADGVSIRGAGFIEVAEASGGSVNSICEDSLTSAVENIQRTIISIVTEYKLDATPLIETIKVKIGGVEIQEDGTNGWTYSVDKNTVSFHGSAIPSADMKVEVTFKPKELD